MSFREGRVTFLRFQVHGPRPRLFTEEHLARLKAQRAGRGRNAHTLGVDTGWTAGEHILDTDFDLAKNIINDALLFDLRIDTIKPPAELLRAYTAIELKALSKGHPSGFGSKKQLREAREIARERLEQESKDGRYTKRKCIPVLWDSKTNEVLFAASAIASVDHFAALFQSTFDHALEAITAGKRAQRLAELHERKRAVDDASPSLFVRDGSTEDVAWVPDESSRDFLGNEFLLWLWWQTETEGDTLRLLDDSEAAVMLARTLTLECPRAATGSETIRHEMPNRLPEAKRAVQSGKLPRKAGITVVRHGETTEFALAAETLAVSAAKLPPMSEEIIEPRARQEERIDQIRTLIETLDLIYDAFGRVRLSAEWKRQLPLIQKWLQRN